MFAGFNHLCQADEEPSLRGKRFYFVFFFLYFPSLGFMRDSCCNAGVRESDVCWFQPLCQADEEPNLRGKRFFFVFFPLFSQSWFHARLLLQCRGPGVQCLLDSAICVKPMKSPVLEANGFFCFFVIYFPSLGLMQDPYCGARVWESDVCWIQPLCQADEEPCLRGKRFYFVFFSFIFLVLVSCETPAATQGSESLMFAGFSHLY